MGAKFCLAEQLNYFLRTNRWRIFIYGIYTGHNGDFPQVSENDHLEPEFSENVCLKPEFSREIFFLENVKLAEIYFALWFTWCHLMILICIKISVSERKYMQSVDYLKETTSVAPLQDDCSFFLLYPILPTTLRHFNEDHSPDKIGETFSAQKKIL